VRAALGETAGIEGDDAIGLTQPLGHLSNQHLDQRTMLPWRCTDEVLDDLAFDIDQGSDRLSILAVQVGQETRQIAMHMGLAGLGLKSLLIDLLYLSPQLAWWYTLTGAMMVESRRLVAQ